MHKNLSICWFLRITGPINMDLDILPTLVLHVSDDVAADSVLRHRAEVALLGLDLL